MMRNGLGSAEKMHHIKVAWDHHPPDQPLLLYSELDGDRMEVRKVEIFRSGRPGSASAADSHGPTKLGEAPVPPLSEIGVDPEFQPAETTQEEFERVWGLVTGDSGFIAIVNIEDPADVIRENGVFHLAEVSDWEPGGHFSEVEILMTIPIQHDGAERDRFRASVRQLGSPFLAGESIGANFMSVSEPNTDGSNDPWEMPLMFVGALEIIDMSANPTAKS